MNRVFKNIIAGLVVGLVAAPLATFAQEAHPCGTYQAMDALMAKNPAYAEEFARYLNQMAKAANNPEAHLRQQTTKTIPVVVHIIHTGGASNISDAQVFDAIQVLNRDFNKQNADTSGIVAAFSPIAAKIGVEFKLAQLNPDGNCTSGITRTFSSFANSAGENVKGLISWDPAKYLNIWVVQNIESGAGGYSILPCAPSEADGIVIRNSQFGTIGTGSPWGLSARSLTHEAGHYLGLPHTWGHSNTPGLASNCSIDDGIADTPNTTGVSGGSCNTNANSCGNLNNVQNFMDYSNCPLMFTQGQKAAIHTALDLSCRTSLWSNANLVATGTYNGFQISSCTPTVSFTADVTRICEGGMVYFEDQSESFALNPNTSRLWTFPGGTPATSTSLAPIVTYATAGDYTVTLAVTNAGGTTTVQKTNLIKVISTSGALQLPVAEGFENTDFPANLAEPEKSWELQNSTTNTWHRTTLAKAEGNYSMRIQQQYIPPGRENSLLTPNIDLTGITNPVLRFKLAYALPQNANTGTDQFRVLYSTDCGKTWNMLYNKSGASLATTTQTETNFVPSSDQWREETLNLTSSAPFVMLKFESISGNTNALYLDAIQISETITSTSENVAAQEFVIYPNPSNGTAQLAYDVVKNGTTSLVIYNALGQVIYKTQQEETIGRKVQQLPSGHQKLPAGVYLVKLQTEQQTQVKKLIVN